MPAGKAAKNDDSNGKTPSNPAHRTTFRPPWVKEGPNALPMPAAPWTMNKRGSRDANVGEEGPIGIQLRKTSLKSTPQTQENGTATKENTFVRPQLRPVPPKEKEKVQKEVLVPINLKKVEDRPRESIAPVVTEPRRMSFNNTSKEEVGEIDKACPSTRNDIVRQESMKKLGPPKAPPLPPPAPALPKLIETNLSNEQSQKLELLRARPKTRPDWSAVLKNIENGRKLKHVETNDRSSPLLPDAKAKGQFLYDSEKEKLNSAHNTLLKEIQSGINLKRVKTNDRSKPVLEGLRKFRRQMTIEEQIQKSVSMASIPPEEIADEADEMDDIDKVRDDLQSTKQLLAFELRAKEAQMRENKKLQAKIQNLEAELEKEKSCKKDSSNAGAPSAADEKVITSLKAETEQAKKISEELEKKYTTAAEDLDKSKAEFEDMKRQKLELEKRLQEALSGKRMSLSGRQGSVIKSESEGEVFSEVSESEDEGEETEEKRERRVQRELKLMRNKLKSFKNKEDNAKKERVALKDLMKKGQTAMKEEKKKFKQLQKEVDKISAMMKDSSEDEEEEEEEEEDEKEESETETESSESESESESDSDSDSEKSLSEDEDAPNEKKKDNLTKRSKRHENILGALKKGNYMLKTNVERLQDDLNKQKELTAALQDDLNSVLAELG